MELRPLRAFVEVVRQGSFSSAAAAVSSTQSTMSKAVKQLEAELGLPLLERKGARPSLTAAGEIVYRRAVAMLTEREDLLADLAELRGIRRGTLRIGLPPVGSDALFAPLFATYRSRYPGIEIQLVEHGSKRLEELVLRGELDVAASLLPVSEELEFQEVRREPIDVLLRAGDIRASASALELADLADRPFILFEAGFALNPIILESCRQAGFAPAVAARSSQIDFIIALVAAGLGIGFLPRMIADQRPHPEVRRIPVSGPEMFWQMALIWRRGAPLPHAARAWLTLAGV